MYYVYFITDHNIPYPSISDIFDEQYEVFVKIGFAKDIQLRLKDLQTANPRELHIYNYIEYETRWDAMNAEKNIHKRLQQHNVRGEWFKFKECKHTLDDTILWHIYYN